MFTVAGLFPLQSVMLLMPCHMLLALLVLNCSSTLFLYCRLAALMDFLRSFSIVKVPGFKGRCPRWQGCSNNAVNPRFLVGVDTNCFGRNHVLYALPDETHYRIWVRLYVVIRRCPEHVPVHVIKTVLQYSVRLVRPALNCPEGGCFSFQFLPISRQEQNGRMIWFAERWAGERL